MHRVKIIDAKIKQYPAWIDKSLAPILEKKANIPFWYKMSELVFVRGKYMDWPTVEKYLDILIEKIKATNVQFDAIVGIKSGGAILTKYIAEKLDLPYYYVKLSDKDYNCNKKPIDILNYLYKYIIGRKKIYNVCEPIEFDLSNKTILLFDESINTGDTLLGTINYLLKDKGASKVVPATVISRDDIYGDYKPLYVIKGIFDHIWPWGYDN